MCVNNYMQTADSAIFRVVAMPGAILATGQVFFVCRVSVFWLLATTTGKEDLDIWEALTKVFLDS